MAVPRTGIRPGVVYQVAKRMVELSPSSQQVKGRLQVIDSKSSASSTSRPGSFYQVVPPTGPGNLGTNPHGILFDEVITQPVREFGTPSRPAWAPATSR